MKDPSVLLISFVDSLNYLVIEYLIVVYEQCDGLRDKLINILVVELKRDALYDLLLVIIVGLKIVG